MRNSKRAQNQKKKLSRVKRSRKQRGSSDPDKKKTKHFTVYYNYIVLNFPNEDGRNGEFLTRTLTPYELGVCRDSARETREAIIGQYAPQFAYLEVGLVAQLEEPYDGKRFSLPIKVYNKSNDQAIDLIRNYMDEIASEDVRFDWPHRPAHESDDQTRYVITTREEIEIEETPPIGGSRNQRGATPPKIAEQIFYVYYNYLTRDLENRQRDKTVLLTRQLSLYERDVCQKHMKQAKESILEKGFGRIEDLKVHDVEQLRQPRNNNHFKVSLTIKNNTYNDAITLINSYMEGAADGVNLMFVPTVLQLIKSDDLNHYQNTYQNIEITDFLTDF